MFFPIRDPCLRVLFCFAKETIAKAIEEKISREQRRYLLNEQLKAIKKVCTSEF